MVGRVTKRMLEPTFVCNRHPRHCIRSHRDGGPPCDRHPLLCRWWVERVRLDLHRMVCDWNKRMGPGSPGGRFCLRRSGAAGRAYRLDNRRRSAVRDVQQLMRCATTQPPAAPAQGPTTGVLAPWLSDRAMFWQRAWHDVYAFAAESLPGDVRHLLVSHLTDLTRRLDAVFWDGTLHGSLAHRGWTFGAGTVRDRFKDQVDRADPRRTWPVASMTVHRARRTLLLEVETHPGYWPAYPHHCDGIRVGDRRAHLCHVVAHETVHMVRAIFDDVGDGMYNAGFQALNLWVYGHTSHVDNAATDTVAPTVV